MLSVSTVLPAEYISFDTTRHVTSDDLQRRTEDYLGIVKWAENLQSSIDTASIPLLYSIDSSLCQAWCVPDSYLSTQPSDSVVHLCSP